MQYLKMTTLAKNGVCIKCYWPSYVEPTLVRPASLEFKSKAGRICLFSYHSRTDRRIFHRRIIVSQQYGILKTCLKQVRYINTSYNNVFHNLS